MVRTRVEKRLTVVLGRTPAPQELAQELGLSGREVQAAELVPARVGSLAERFGDADVGSELSERIADDRPGPEALGFRECAPWDSNPEPAD